MLRYPIGFLLCVSSLVGEVSGQAAQKAPPSATFVAEFAIRSPVGLTEFKSRIAKRLAALHESLGETTVLFGPGMLPLTGRVYVDLTKVEDTAAGRSAPVLVQIDCPKVFDLSRFTRGRDPGMRPIPGLENAWTDGETTAWWIERPDGNWRLVIGTGYGTDPRRAAVFRGLPPAKLRKSEQRILDTAREGFAYLFCRLGPFAAHNPQLRQTLGLVGPNGWTLAASMVEQQDGLALVVESGIRVGAGMIGMALPPRTAKVEPLGGFGPELGVAVLIDLGEDAERSLAPLMAMLVASKSVSKEVKGAVQTLLRHWTGRISSYASPTVDAVMFSSFMEFEESSAKQAFSAFKVLMKQVSAGDLIDNNGRISMKAPNAGRAAAWLDEGLLAMCRVPEQSSVDLQDLVGARPGLIPMLDRDQAPIKCWLGPAFIASARARTQARKVEGGHDYQEGWRFGNDLVYMFADQGVLMSLSWDRRRTRLVMRFR